MYGCQDENEMHPNRQVEASMNLFGSSILDTPQDEEETFIEEATNHGNSGSELMLSAVSSIQASEFSSSEDGELEVTDWNKSLQGTGGLQMGDLIGVSIAYQINPAFRREEGT